MLNTNPLANPVHNGSLTNGHAMWASPPARRGSPMRNQNKQPTPLTLLGQGSRSLVLDVPSRCLAKRLQLEDLRQEQRFRKARTELPYWRTLISFMSCCLHYRSSRTLALLQAPRCCIVRVADGFAGNEKFNSSVLLPSRGVIIGRYWQRGAESFRADRSYQHALLHQVITH
jgi:hypothetical protein